MKPTFSIVVPTLNEERFLPNLLESFIYQTDQDFEVIISDGHSDDDTVNVAKRFSSKFPSLSIISSDRRGVSYQRNVGSSAAKGKYIISTDADSYFYPYCLDRVKVYLKRRSAKHLTSWFSCDTHNPNDALIILLINAGMEISLKMKHPAGYGAFMVTDRMLFEKTGGYDESLEFGEDNDLCRRINEHGCMMEMIREPLVTYSLRRFHKLGTLRAFQTTAWISFVFLLTKRTPARLPNYVMGGQYYMKERVKKRKNLFDQYEKVLRKLKEELMK